MMPAIATSKTPTPRAKLARVTELLAAAQSDLDIARDTALPWPMRCASSRLYAQSAEQLVDELGELARTGALDVLRRVLANSGGHA
ncbi:hypothetical protein [Acidimangrovimonas sediminis]|uniref:hypothetical protein n=1 Tax=Acidimangrovimonas sediminis TaxID=2056283 RepID=UPI0011AF963D|nr:hypothetical protein [Acidimangrovimonas sediminis]